MRMFSEPPSTFLIFQMYVFSGSRNSVVCPTPSGSCDALTVALGTGIRTMMLLADLRREGRRGEGRGGEGRGGGGRVDSGMKYH